MSELIVIAFPSEEQAEEVRGKLLEMQKNYLIEIEDAVVALKRDDGQIKLNQLVNLTATSAISGGFWGTLIGALFLNPLLGAAIGAAGGALSGALSDIGINDRFMRDVSQVLQPGSAALFVLVRRMTEDKVLEQLSGVGGTVLRTSLDHTKEEQLRAALQGTRAQLPPEVAPPAG
jgi:uncharacterized membrane protein